jgi:GST-like protein
VELFESGAILIYLAEKTGKLLPADPIARLTALQWLMWQMGGVGPMFGQWNHFASYAPEKLPYAIERYTNEVKRLYRVAEKRLAQAAYFGVDVVEFPHLKRWLDAVAARPAVQRGVEVLAERRRKGTITDAEREVMFGKTQFAAR